MRDTKSSKTFQCIPCDYITSRRSQWERHILTGKHQKETNCLQIGDKKVPLDTYECQCGNQYSCRQSLWRHRKTCFRSKSSESSESSEPDDSTNMKCLTELVKDIIKQNISVINQNKNLTETIIDICKTSQTNNVSNNTVHSNNQTFNLQFFLNETCKDAMNISDFVDSIKLQISDLEKVGEKGFVEGISNVVIDNLEELDSRQRPIHCSDQKREILYIKDNNEWVKDEKPNEKMSKIIKQIANKNIKNIPEWVKLNPGCCSSDSKTNDKYLKIVSNSMSGCTELEQKTNISKIISRVAKEVTINKNNYQISK